MQKDKKFYSLKELEDNINLEEFTKEWCSDDGLDLNELSKKYNGSKRNLERYAGNHCLKRSILYMKNKRQLACLKKYGVESPFQDLNVKEKIDKTNLKKYGTKYPTQNKEIQNKIRKNNLQKYGVEYISQSKEIKDKVKKTNLEKYGVEYILQNKDFKEKIKQTNLERYGFPFSSQNETIKQKVKQTCLENMVLNIHVKQIFVKPHLMECIQNPTKTLLNY